MSLNVPQQLFLDQARSDYEIFRFLSRRDVCHRLHYLQMCTEKLAKVYLWRTGSFPGFGHDKFVPLLRTLEPRSDFRELFGYQDPRRFSPQKMAIFNLARKIQTLAPAHGNNVQNPEYPWPPSMPTTGPLIHQFAEWQDWNDTTAGRRLKYFVENLLQNYLTVFP